MIEDLTLALGALLHDSAGYEIVIFGYFVSMETSNQRNNRDGEDNSASDYRSNLIWREHLDSPNEENDQKHDNNDDKNVGDTHFNSPFQYP